MSLRPSPSHLPSIYPTTNTTSVCWDLYFEASHDHHRGHKRCRRHHRTQRQFCQFFGCFLAYQWPDSANHQHHHLPSHLGHRSWPAASLAAPPLAFFSDGVVRPCSRSAYPTQFTSLAFPWLCPSPCLCLATWPATESSPASTIAWLGRLTQVD